MSAAAYRTVVVGTDGSESSLRAVARAGALAGACDAELIVACAPLPEDTHSFDYKQAEAALREDAYQVVGSHPAEDKVRTAAERAHAAGARKVRTIAVVGSPVPALMEIVHRENADLLVVGNRGLNGLKGRIVGSVPSDATRRAECDVLVVHTID